MLGRTSVVASPECLGSCGQITGGKCTLLFSGDAIPTNRKVEDPPLALVCRASIMALI